MNDFLKIDILCPLYNASRCFDVLMKGIIQQKNVQVQRIVFPVTESDDNTYELAKSVSNAVVMKVSKKEFSHSLTRELAMKKCISDIVVFLSQDVYLSDEMALYNLAKCIDGNIVYSFARQITKSKGIEKYTRQKNYPPKSYIMSVKDIEKQQIKTFYSSDACSAYNRKVFEGLKGFDGKIFQVSEDMYYCRKAILSGYSIKYCAESVVIHSHQLSLKELYARYYNIGLFFAQNPEFKLYKSTNAGLKLALYVLGQALKHFDIPSLFRWGPDMIARYLGKRKGQRSL